MTEWRAIPNPMRDDGSFLCDGEDRTYPDGRWQLPTAVTHAQMEHSAAQDIAAAHNKALEEVQRELDALRAKPSPLLQCVDCKNTESPAGAMARYFNKGRCVHCGGWFKVVRA